MRQPFKEKFLNDVDGDGMPIPYAKPMSLLNLGRSLDHPVVQGLLADHRCMRCEALTAPYGVANDIDKKGDILRDVYADLVADLKLQGVSVLSDNASPEQFVGRRK